MLLSALQDIVRGNGVDMMQLIITILVSLLIIFVMLPLHECAHATVAGWLGDKTAQMLGRRTLNPLKHIDYMGSLMLMLVGFGWAKPVPVNMSHRKNERGAMALVALAGPVSNLLAAVVGGLLMNLVVTLDPLSISIFTQFGVMGNPITAYLVLFLYYFIAINISLAVFNLIPVPPLDGSKIIMAFLPRKACNILEANEGIISIVLMVLIFMGAFSGPLSILQGWFTSGILKLTGLPFGISW